MADVINLDDVRKNWRTASADCLTCNYTWQAVFPDGAHLGLECPKCGKMHGWASPVWEKGNEKAQIYEHLKWCMENGIGPYKTSNAVPK